MKKWMMRLLVLALLVASMPVMAQDATEEAEESEEMEALVNLGSNDESDYLVGPNGMTLYLFTRDTPGTSNCYDRCAENWPPLLVESEDELTIGEGIPGVLDLTERTDGTMQVTYNGWPLYYWVNDAEVGDTTGDAVGGVWWIVEPATLYVGGNEELGKFLVGPTGMTVYVFTNDEPGVSNCTEQCLENWPAVTVESEEDLYVGRTVPGEVDLIEREDDGMLQLTYNGWPLYYWKDDAAIGDATGENVGEVWFTIPPETVSVGGNDELGAFLVDPRGMTLYTFTDDTEGVSNCTEQCLEAWPAYTAAANDRLVLPEGVEGELGAIEREDGVFQVTFNGMPLYYFAEDAAEGDATGQNVGEKWFVVPVEETE